MTRNIISIDLDSCIGCHSCAVVCNENGWVRKQVPSGKRPVAHWARERVPHRRQQGDGVDGGVRASTASWPDRARLRPGRDKGRYREVHHVRPPYR